MVEGKILKVSGPLVIAEGMREANMFDVVRVGDARLIGEIIEMHGDRASIQVYEETAGIGRGDRVVSTGAPLSVELGPGLIKNIYDGIQRPLEIIREKYGANITKGIDEPALSREKRWHFTPAVAYQDEVSGGDVLGTVQETDVILHRIMVPPKMKGKIVEIREGDFRVDETVAKIKDNEGNIVSVSLMQKWPVRVARPYREKLPPVEPMITGQRVIDALFPIAKGGTACVPGPFGSGKTVVQHQLAKWSDVDLVVYIGCGERGNEMTDVLREFPELTDPRTGKSLMERTVLIANTSDMPVAAREASIYTGITIAEYYRDMGYDIAIMADSTSRWAEALREISGRLEEMPAEEGFPAYLPSRLSEFYERAGSVETLNGKTGSVTVIGAVSPQGSDFSEPVTQNTKRFVRCFWALDKSLAYARHYPAIDWNSSYSEYVGDLADYYDQNCGADFLRLRQEISGLLAEENKLMEIVKLIGADVLPDDQKLVMETARAIRVGFLQQNAYHKDDTYVPLEKQKLMMRAIVELYRHSLSAIRKGAAFSAVMKLGFFERVSKLKFEIPNDRLSMFDDYFRELDEAFAAL